MEQFHFTAALMVVVVPGALAVAKFVVKEFHEFWRFLQGLRWK